MADTIRTENDLLTNLFQDGQAPNSITAQDVRDLIVSTKFLGMSGMSWEFIYDNDYTAGSPLLIEDGNRVQITISSNPAEELRYPATAPSCWVGNRLQPQALNGFGFIRLSFLAWPSSFLSARFRVSFDISASGSANTIYEQTSVFAIGAGSNNTEAFNYIIPVFCGPDFVANGGRFYIEPTNTDINLFRTTLTMFQAFLPNPAA